MSWLIRLFLAGFCVATLGSIAARDARAETRVALVVGNAGYERADVLANTVNDAVAVSSVLKKAGFDVDERDNLGVVEFKRAVRDFARTAANADIAVVYYSGYGMGFDGRNYLIPTDARLANDSDVEDEAIPLDRVLAATHAAKKFSLIILDACRE
ncbi:MAG: caspase family protein, partial [Roseiarcus sp.]